MSIMDEILEERARQRTEWSEEHDDEHDARDWVTLIVAILGQGALSAWYPDRPELWRRALIKGAACCVAALESHDRREA